MNDQQLSNATDTNLCGLSSLISLLTGMLLSQPWELTMKAGIARLEEHVLPLGHDLLVEPPVLADHSWVNINLLVNMNVETPYQNWVCHQSNITSISTLKENSSPPPQYNQLASSIFSLQHLSNISLHPKITVWRKCLSLWSIINDQNLDGESSEDVENHHRDKAAESEEDSMGWKVCLMPKLQIATEWWGGSTGLVSEGLNVHLPHDHGHDGVEAVDHVIELGVTRKRDGKGKEEATKDAGICNKELHHSLANLCQAFKNI